MMNRQAVAADERPAFMFTWQWLGRLVAFGLLLAMWGLWTKVQWIEIGPAFAYTSPDGHQMMSPITIAEGVLDSIMALALGAAMAFVPPIFWSSLIPQSPANNLLSWMHRRYGTAGWIFAIAGALFFTALSFQMLTVYLDDRPFIHQTYTTLQVYVKACTIEFLTIGFTAWILNMLTPDEWVSAMQQAREVAEIRRHEQLADLQFKIVFTRALSIMRAKILMLVIEQFRPYSAKLVAALAEMQLAEAIAWEDIAALLKGLGAADILMPIEYNRQKQEIIKQRYRHIHQLMIEAAERKHQVIAAAGYSPGLPVPRQEIDPASAVVVQEADDLLADVDANVTVNVTANVATASGRGERPLAATDDGDVATIVDRGSQSLQEAPANDGWALLIRTHRYFGYGSWSAMELANKVDLGESTAGKLIAEWHDRGYIIKGKFKGQWSINPELGQKEEQP